MGYGCKRIHVLLPREGWRINHKRVYRLYREEGLRRRHEPLSRRVSGKMQEDRRPATAANECWSMDFLHDELFDGRRIRVLTIVDDFTRVSPAIGAKVRYTAMSVIAILEDALKEFGTPKCICLYNGPESVSKELDLWAYRRGILLDFSCPGRPTDNAFVEAFNSRFCQTVPNQGRVRVMTKSQ